ncbi:hypothetical protein NPIL_51971 [Nephila pilipes]|uniref:Uncharacterized protein n=1 Tax=Nephila pilipes TaxID=299642 RepID=A0A8X6TZ83_NEPPI|nr:hypothetical protein NPIL_51971 [Nephila pilipes]
MHPLVLIGCESAVIRAWIHITTSGWTRHQPTNVSLILIQGCAARSISESTTQPPHLWHSDGAFSPDSGKQLQQPSHDGSWRMGRGGCRRPCRPSMTRNSSCDVLIVYSLMTCW